MPDHLPRLDIRAIGHVNHVVPSYDEARSHYEDLLGARYLMEIGANPTTDGCLLDVGGEIVEILAPKTLEKAEGKQLVRYGPHYAGMELLVPDRHEALATIKARGIETLLELPSHFYTKPSSTRGVVLQIWDGDWHVEPRHDSFVNAKRGTVWWRDHPMGIVGLAHVAIACTDLDESVAWWCDLTGGKETYRAARPQAAAVAAGVHIGVPIELLAPTGEGPLAAYIDRYGTRIRSVVFRVADVERTRAYFASRGIALVAGDAPGALALPPEHNLGVLLEFVEGKG